MESFSAYMPLDRRHALARGKTLPEEAHGAVLITDVSGFTPLTEALVAAYGIQHGAEELSQHLNNVYRILIAEVVRYHGSVISSAGDALLSWFDGDENEAAQRAVATAFAMQKALAEVATISMPNGQVIELAIKSAAAAGSAHRFLVGDPEVQVFEMLAGSLLDRLDQAEHSAHRGEIVVTAETAVWLKDQVIVIEQRRAEDGSSISVINKLNQVSVPQPWPPSPSLTKDQSKPWLHPFIFEYINSGQEMFMAALRPAVSLFMNFKGIDYDGDPDAATKLDTFFRWVQKNVTHYDGTLVAILTGDKGSYLYIALGTPYAHEDDAKRATALAQSLLALPSELNFIHSIQIGISSGVIWSGPVGGQDWRTFTAIGSEVNLAARLMQAAQPGHMLVSEQVAEATAGAYQWQFLQKISVKGIAKPIKVYEASTSKTVPRVTKPSASTTMVGRQAEQMLLSEMLQKTNANTSKVAIIEGEAGIGKSRLVSNLLSEAQTSGIPALIGAGYAIEQSTPYHAWRPIFESVFDLENVEDGDSRREKALSWINQHDASLLDRAPLLAPVLSLDVQDNSLTTQMQGQVRAENTRGLLVAILMLFVADDPKLLVLEDTHWFDSSSLALAADAVRGLANVMIVISTRPIGGDSLEHLGPILDLPQTHRIHLEQMNQSDIATLVCHRLGVSNLPEEVATLILGKAEGHPFFSEELAYSLRDSGVIVVGNGECKVAADSDLRALNFPDTVQGVVRSRIDRLVPSHQLALKAASVVGRVFALRAVHEVYPLDTDKPQIPNYFEHLRQLDLTPLNSENPDLTYLFKHVITQEVTYNLMPFSQRKTFHESVATWYEHTYADDLSPYYGVLAYHWRNTKNSQRTMEYLEKAGEQAMTNFANREAIDFFEEAARLVEKKEVKVSALRFAHWQRQLAEAHYGLGELPQSLAYLKKSIHSMGWKTPEAGPGLVTSLLGEVFKQVRFRMKPKPIEDRPLPTYLDDTQPAKLLEGAIAFVRLGQIYYQMNQPILLIFGTLVGINLAEKSGLKSPILARCYTNMCIASGVLPRHDWAIAYRNRAHPMGRDANDLPSLAYALAGCAVYELGAALWDDAAKSLNEAMEIDARIGDMRHYDESKSILAIALFHQGEFPYGLDTAAEVLERAARRKDIIPQVWSYTMRAEIVLRKSKPGTLNQAIADYEATLKLLEQNIDLASDIRASGALALTYWRNQEPQRALDLATATAKKTVGNPTAPYSIEGYAGVAEVFLSAWEGGDTKQRAAAQKACQAMAKYTGVFPLGAARLKLFQGWFDQLDGKHEKAQAEWQNALAETERLKLPYEQARALSFLGRYNQKNDERIQSLNRALEIFEKLDVYYEAEQIKKMLVPTRE